MSPVAAYCSRSSVRPFLIQSGCMSRQCSSVTCLYLSPVQLVDVLVSVCFPLYGSVLWSFVVVRSTSQHSWLLERLKVCPDRDARRQICRLEMMLRSFATTLVFQGVGSSNPLIGDFPTTEGLAPSIQGLKRNIGIGVPPTRRGRRRCWDLERLVCKIFLFSRSSSNNSVHLPGGGTSPAHDHPVSGRRDGGGHGLGWDRSSAKGLDWDSCRLLLGCYFLRSTTSHSSETSMDNTKRHHPKRSKNQPAPTDGRKTWGGRARGHRLGEGASVGGGGVGPWRRSRVALGVGVGAPGEVAVGRRARWRRAGVWAAAEASVVGVLGAGSVAAAGGGGGG